MIKSYKEFTLNESYGYIESFLNNSDAENALSNIVKQISNYINASSDSAEEEGLSQSEQKNLIIKEITDYIKKKVG